MGTDNSDFANRHQKFANEPPLQTTLRELQDIIANPRFWIGFCAVMILLAITGPFGTIELMGTSQRLVYWSTICLATFFVGTSVSMVTGIFLTNRGLPNWVSWLTGGIAAGLPVGTIAWGLNIHVFDVNIAASYTFPQFIAYTTVIAVVIVLLNYLIVSKTSNRSAHSLTSSPFFVRLPIHLGQTLISLEAQDHYINVKTTKGSEMILMRLADAEKELENYPGLRVHRSWWVATDAIDKVERGNGKVELVMHNGDKLPVSRSYVKALVEAGVK